MANEQLKESWKGGMPSLEVKFPYADTEMCTEDMSFLSEVEGHRSREVRGPYAETEVKPAEPKGGKRKLNTLQSKRELQHIENGKVRNTTYVKRRKCIFRKAEEFSVLAGVKMAVILCNNMNKVFSYSTPAFRQLTHTEHGKILIRRCLTPDFHPTGSQGDGHEMGDINNSHTLYSPHDGVSGSAGEVLRCTRGEGSSSLGSLPVEPKDENTASPPTQIRSGSKSLSERLDRMDYINGKLCKRIKDGPTVSGEEACSEKVLRTDNLAHEPQSEIPGRNEPGAETFSSSQLLGSNCSAYGNPSIQQANWQSQDCQWHTVHEESRHQSQNPQGLRSHEPKNTTGLHHLEYVQQNYCGSSQNEQRCSGYQLDPYQCNPNWGGGYLNVLNSYECVPPPLSHQPCFSGHSQFDRMNVPEALATPSENWSQQVSTSSGYLPSASTNNSMTCTQTQSYN